MAEGRLRLAFVLAEEHVRPRQRHRHVEIGAAVLESCVQDRRVEPGIGRVEDRIRTGLAQQSDELVNRSIGCTQTGAWYCCSSGNGR